MGGGLEKQALGKKMVVVGKLDYLTTLETGSKQALFVWKRAKVREMSREVRGKSVED
jgi:23S rRNA G2069 N7-methylase RlmK/C1962 C5-methylase RlmI